MTDLDCIQKTKEILYIITLIGTLLLFEVSARLSIPYQLKKKKFAEYPQNKKQRLST